MDITYDLSMSFIEYCNVYISKLHEFLHPFPMRNLIKNDLRMIFIIYLKVSFKIEKLGCYLKDLN